MEVGFPDLYCLWWCLWMAHLVGGQVPCKERVVRDEKLGFKQMKESQWKWIARSRAKNTCFFLFWCPKKILRILARSCAKTWLSCAKTWLSCAFLRGAFGFEIRNCVMFSCLTCWGQESEFQKAGEQDLYGFSIAAEEKYRFCLWTRSAQNGEVALPKRSTLEKDDWNQKHYGNWKPKKFCQKRV